MVDNKEKDKFDLGVKGLRPLCSETHETHFSEK